LEFKQLEKWLKELRAYRKIDDCLRAESEEVKMTREEAIFCEKSYIGETDCRDCNYYGTNTCKSKEAHKMAVKALEQESVLDKVRAEIENLEEGISSDLNDRPLVYKDEVLQIIDKYRTETEGEE
jgi:hypothetical protein